MRVRRVWVLALVLPLLAVTPSLLYGQHSFTPDEIAAGGQIYRTNCAQRK